MQAARHQRPRPTLPLHAARCMPHAGTFDARMDARNGGASRLLTALVRNAEPAARPPVATPGNRHGRALSSKAASLVHVMASSPLKCAEASMRASHVCHAMRGSVTGRRSGRRRATPAARLRPVFVETLAHPRIRIPVPNDERALSCVRACACHVRVLLYLGVEPGNDQMRWGECTKPSRPGSASQP